MSSEFQSLMAGLGQIDIYLLDQVMRGRLRPPMRILDAGCGGGRNLAFFMRAGFDACGADQDAAAMEQVRAMAAELAPGLSPENFVAERIDGLTFADASFDAVISNAVLHFAKDEEHFERMLVKMWRTLRPGGIFFARLASSIGIEDRVRKIEGRRHHLPDGSIRFLVDEAMLLDYTERLRGRLIDPIKTVNVQGLRCMTTWVIEKGGR